MTDRSMSWLLIGFAGQAIFTARFLVQWVESERRRDSVVPVAFWWLSLLGGGLLLAYACSRSDPVIVAGQSLGVFVYVRNLMLVKKNRRRTEKAWRRAQVAQGVIDADLQACPVCRKAA
jgi:lipid-A-disaccharide synthase-like uncharacterized protein